MGAGQREGVGGRVFFVLSSSLSQRGRGGRLGLTGGWGDGTPVASSTGSFGWEGLIYIAKLLPLPP